MLGIHSHAPTIESKGADILLYEPSKKSEDNFSSELKRKIIETEELSGFNVSTADDIDIFKSNYCSPTVIQNLSSFSET